MEEEPDACWDAGPVIRSRPRCGFGGIAAGEVVSPEPMKMRAVQLEGPGADRIAVVEREVAPVREGEVLLRMGGACLNYHDAVVIWGLIPGMQYPRIPLSDGCGTIESIGAGVADFTVGERVTPNFYPSWQSGPPTLASKQPIPGESVDGRCASHVVVDARCLVRAPHHLTELETGTLPCAALTAWRALRDGGIAARQTVVVQGTGGVSLFALQIAKAHGARVILTSSSAEKLERGRELGADEGIDYTAHPEWSGEVLRLTGGRGADLVVDVGGQGSLGQSVLATRIAGHVAIVGVLGGFGNAEIPVTVAMTRNIKMQGVTVGSRNDFDDLCRFLERHEVRPIISDTFAMGDLGRAVAHLEAGRHIGKIAIEIGDS